MTDQLKYFHGGQRGLTRGSLLLPPSRTNARHTLADAAEKVTGQPWDRANVYVTTEFRAALMYAVLHPSGGWVYEVEPIGELTEDADCTEPGLSFAVPEARIVRIHIPNKWQRKDVFRAFKESP